MKGTAEPASFRFRRQVEVRFRDLDSVGHVHHSVPLAYFEEARADWWREIAGGTQDHDTDYIIAEATLGYHGRIRYPGRPTVGVRATRLGRSSFDLEYALWSEAGELLTTGRTVQVMYDYGAGASREIPPEIRRRIAEHEGIPER